MNRYYPKSYHILQQLGTWFVLLSVMFSLCLPAFAVSDYENALNSLTDPTENQVSADRRRPYSNDDRLDAMTAAYKRLQVDGLENLWDLNPELMNTIASQKAIEKGKDPTKLSKAQLKSYITLLDLSLTEPAAMHERSWYDYQLSEFHTGFDYAKKNISAYIFTIRCNGKYIAMLQASVRKSGDFFTAYQPISNVYHTMYDNALAHMPTDMQCPILLTDPNLHQAVAFLIPESGTDKVIVSNYLSSSSKNDFLSLQMVSFQKAALLWNRVTISMLLDVDGKIKPGSSLQYNNLESYVRSQLRVETRERAIHFFSLTFTFLLVIVMIFVILGKVRTRFMDPQDPNIHFGYWVGSSLLRMLQKIGIFPH